MVVAVLMAVRLLVIVVVVVLMVVLMVLLVVVLVIVPMVVLVAMIVVILSSFLDVLMHSTCFCATYLQPRATSSPPSSVSRAFRSTLCWSRSASKLGNRSSWEGKVWLFSM